MKIVIIGGGLAGLQCAKELISNYSIPSKDIVIVEARNRTGGRIHTIPLNLKCQSEPFPFDVGAAWIHGIVGHPFCPIAKENNITLKQISLRNPWLYPESCSYAVYLDKTQMSSSDIQEGWIIFRQFMLKLKEMADHSVKRGESNQEIVPVIQKLLQEAPFRSNTNLLAIGLWGIECWMGTRLELLQLEEFTNIELMGEHPGPHCLVPNGMSQFTNLLQQTISSEIIYNYKVASIDYSQTKHIIIHNTNGNAIICDKVIITVPLGVLKQNDIAFLPHLPQSKQQAISRCDMGQYKKIVLEFTHSFWNTDQFFIVRAGDTRNMQFPLLYNLQAMKGIPALEIVCGMYS